MELEPAELPGPVAIVDPSTVMPRAWGRLSHHLPIRLAGAAAVASALIAVFALSVVSSAAFPPAAAPSLDGPLVADGGHSYTVSATISLNRGDRVVLMTANAPDSHASGRAIRGNNVVRQGRARLAHQGAQRTR